MIRRLILLFALAGVVLAQVDPDIPPQFQNLISPELYHQLRDAHIDLLRGLPADPSLRDQAIQQMLQQQSRLSIALVGGLPAATWKVLWPHTHPERPDPRSHFFRQRTYHGDRNRPGE